MSEGKLGAGSPTSAFMGLSTVGKAYLRLRDMVHGDLP